MDIYKGVMMGPDSMVLDLDEKLVVPICGQT